MSTALTALGSTFTVWMVAFAVGDDGGGRVDVDVCSVDTQPAFCTNCDLAVVFQDDVTCVEVLTIHRDRFVVEQQACLFTVSADTAICTGLGFGVCRTICFTGLDVGAVTTNSTCCAASCTCACCTLVLACAQVQPCGACRVTFFDICAVALTCIGCTLCADGACAA